ncbi:MAG: ABC transporter permease subunit [Deltaproteobacteria bacterium]|nr:ABC transporter permease subunit [Deltaproteobacteria bacterium]
MRAISIIFRRELGAYLRSPIGYIVAAIVLLIDGILFQARALGADKRLSADVLSEFFHLASGTTMIAAVILSVRLVAEERQNGTLVLLNTSPVRDAEIVVGKYLAALVFLAGMTVLSIYMPLLVMVRGKISAGQIVIGYSGLMLIGSAALAMGVFASSLTRHQLLAAALGAALVGGSLLMYYLSKRLDAPLKNVFSSLDLYASHFVPFRNGVLHLKHVVFYLATTYFFLLLSTKTMEAKRWQ